MAIIFRELTLRVAWVRGLLRVEMNAVCAAVQLIPADMLGGQDMRPPTFVRARRMQILRFSYIAVTAAAFVAAPVAAQPVQKEPKRAIATPKTAEGAGDSSQDDCELAGTWRGAVCWDARVKQSDVALNASYKRALAQQGSREQTEELRKSQRAWLQYVSTNCDLIGKLDGRDGPSASFYSLTYRAHEYGERIEFLKRVANEP